MAIGHGERHSHLVVEIGGERGLVMQGVDPDLRPLAAEDDRMGRALLLRDEHCGHADDGAQFRTCRP